MFYEPRKYTIVLMFLVVPAMSCGGSQTESTTSDSSQDAATSLPNQGTGGENIITSGQPTEAELEAAIKADVRTVISLRLESEESGYDEEAKAEALGVRFVRLPIDKKTGLTEENARALDAILNETNGKVLLHCGSGNRAGAMVALRAAYVQGASLEDANQSRQDGRPK